MFYLQQINTTHIRETFKLIKQSTKIGQIYAFKLSNLLHSHARMYYNNDYFSIYIILE